MDKVKLKPCPFCGEDQPFVFEPSCHKDAVYDPRDRAYPLVRCRDCLASVDGENWDHSCRTAIDKWNTRALEAENAALKAQGPVLSEDEVAALERIELLMCKQLRMLGEITDLNETEKAGVMSAMESQRADLRIMRSLLKRAKR